ncbi:hypothetical protein SNE40_016316 [Patella caerulea]|uniref:C-type lectin domain-containing protein n=1 Tax=Patella caerulea TaxID=87958 RepID=A0AAN8P801_PATCE
MYGHVFKIVWMLFSNVIVGTTCGVDYKLITTNSKYTGGQKECARNNLTDLAIINTPYKAERVKAFLQKKFNGGVVIGDVYVGLRQFENWLWVNNKPMVWTNWDSGNGFPSTTSKYDCVFIGPSNGYFWRNDLCWKKKYSVCETPCHEATLGTVPMVDQQITSPPPTSVFTVATRTTCTIHCLNNIDECQYISYTQNKCHLFDWNFNMSDPGTIVTPTVGAIIMKVIR